VERETDDGRLRSKTERRSDSRSGPGRIRSPDSSSPMICGDLSAEAAWGASWSKPRRSSSFCARRARTIAFAASITSWSSTDAHLLPEKAEEAAVWLASTVWGEEAIVPLVSLRGDDGGENSQRKRYSVLHSQGGLVSLANRVAAPSLLLCHVGFRVQVSAFRVQRSGVRVQGSRGRRRIGRGSRMGGRAERWARTWLVGVGRVSGRQSDRRPSRWRSCNASNPQEVSQPGGSGLRGSCPRQIGAVTAVPPHTSHGDARGPRVRHTASAYGEPAPSRELRPSRLGPAPRPTCWSPSKGTPLRFRQKRRG